MKNLIKFIIIFSILSTPVQAACDFLIDIGDSGKKVFDKPYKSIKEAKEILKEFKKKDLLEIAKDIAKENNFKEIHTNLARRGDVVFLKTKEELGAKFGL